MDWALNKGGEVIGDVEMEVGKLLPRMEEEEEEGKKTVELGTDLPSRLELNRVSPLHWWIEPKL